MTQVPQNLTVKEAAERLRATFGKISEETVRRWHREGRIPAITLPGGRTLFIPVEEIEKIERGDRPDMIPAGYERPDTTPDRVTGDAA